MYSETSSDDFVRGLTDPVVQPVSGAGRHKVSALVIGHQTKNVRWRGVVKRLQGYSAGDVEPDPSRLR